MKCVIGTIKRREGDTCKIKCKLNVQESRKPLQDYWAQLHHLGDPKTRNDGMAEWRKITPNPKRRNDGKSPQILKGGMTENGPKS